MSGVNSVNHLSFYMRDRLLKIGGLRDGFEGSEDYDLLLRYTADLHDKEIDHLPILDIFGVAMARVIVPTLWKLPRAMHEKRLRSITRMATSPSKLTKPSRQIFMGAIRPCQIKLGACFSRDTESEYDFFDFLGVAALRKKPTILSSKSSLSTTARRPRSWFI